MAHSTYQPGGTAATSSQVRATPAKPRHHAARVDEQEGRSVSFAANDGLGLEPEAQRAPPLRDGHEGHALVAVGPGVPGSLLLAGRAGLVSANPLPVQGAKIHRPLLRDDVLSRERLNGWLDRASVGRLALIVAEAGFGKTTLLADWARQTQRLTAWYRLEPDDRDWLTFIRHVVGSGRELDPEFAPGTFSLLLQLGPGGPTQAELIATLARELAEFGASTRDGFTLIFDDYHVIDDSEETQPIARAIIDRTGPGFSVILATRSTPRLPLGRLRARGALARLDGDALCFDEPEAERLFRDAYRQPLDPDVVTDLITRTEGWAALLSLVHTNLEESRGTDPRQLVHQLAEVRGDLYEYVAEEVIETLPDRLQEFLTRASLLRRIDVAPASLVYEAGPDEIRGLIDQGEELGLLARPDPHTPHRFHPLVQGFLQARLEAEVGPAGIQAMHRRLGFGLENSNWHASAAHFRAAHDYADAARVVDASLEQILAAGQFEGVQEFLDGSAGPQDRPAALVLRSRLEFARGSLGKAIQLARLAVNGADVGPHSGIALLNLATILGVSGFADEAMELAANALTHPLTEAQRQVAKATVLMWEAGHRGDLAAIADELRALAGRQDVEGHVRYASITRLNLAAVLMWLPEPEESLAASISAELGFRQSGAPDIEKGAALAARATALAHLGRLDEATSLLAQAASSHSVLAREEAALETAKLLSDLGDLDDAADALAHVGPTALDAGFLGLWALISGTLALRRGDIKSAESRLGQLLDSPCHDVGGELRGQLLRTRISVATKGGDAGLDAEVLRDIAIAQGSRPGRLLADILSAMAVGADLSGKVLQVSPEDGPILSALAEEMARNLHQMTSAARGQVSAEAIRYPARWRSALRHVLQDVSPARGSAFMLPVASLLARIGSAEDVALFRSLGSTNRAYRTHAAGLARRLAPSVLVRDLGVVEVLLGDRPVARPVRRKVLALLCFLASRPNQAATRDEALEALWPDLGPDTAANSLHQTIYFLRRVFEPDFREGFSAGYVVFDGEVVSLDDHLVDSSSRRCWRLIKGSGRAGQEHLSELLETYSGRFALDFAYEEWATDYRETLHAAVLAIMEGAISAAFDRRDFDRTIELAHAGLLLDPAADSVELILLRAYKASGRTRAAAEQYSHYSSLLREQLGVEPPPLADV